MNDGERLLNAVREQMAESGTPEVPEVIRVNAAGAVYLLRSMHAERLAAVFKWNRANRSNVRGLYARLIVASLVDAMGAPLLTDPDIPAVEAWPASTLEALAGEIAKHNRVG